MQIQRRCCCCCCCRFLVLLCQPLWEVTYLAIPPCAAFLSQRFARSNSCPPPCTSLTELPLSVGEASDYCWCSVVLSMCYAATAFTTTCPCRCSAMRGVHALLLLLLLPFLYSSYYNLTVPCVSPVASQLHLLLPLFLSLIHYYLAAPLRALRRDCPYYYYAPSPSSSSSAPPPSTSSAPSTFSAPSRCCLLLPPLPLLLLHLLPLVLNVLTLIFLIVT